MFVVILIGFKHIPRLILHYGMTSYLVTNANWNYLEEGGNMSGDIYTTKSMKFGGRSVMVWGAMKEDRTKIVTRCSDRLNFNGYMDVLNK